MNIHEYQAKRLLQEYGVPVPRGYAAQTSIEVDTAISHLSDEEMIVVKAQIHAGGRGKGTFTDGYQGGVKVVKGRAAAKEAANHMLDNTLVTAQTGPEGRKVQTLYVTEGCDIDHEYYLAIVLDRETAQSVIIASTEGGMDIEEVADKTPEKLIRVPISPTLGLRHHQARQVAYALGFAGDQVKQFTRILSGVYKMFWEKNAMLVEINPLVTDKSGNLSALDAKVSFDDNAIFQHPEIQQLRDLNEEDPKEIEASKHNLAYIALDGNIACMVNGAGLAMATMDIIQSYGGSPANFLDVGGGANEDQVTAAFKIILSDPNVKGILVNIFGGIMKCDVIARGIVAAAKNVDITVPLVVRLEGTNVEAGKQILRDSGVALTPADSLVQAAEIIVEQVKAEA
ncbi:MULTISPECIES: ADP-forming succinate--CoA ligase subunit beta [unclassified Lentimonas]|uniref:ADP-forming succinate--CoA ligase subunit beta n=1 Tax=unclassified Lentimonas TaxID=2630993 RepID=UPI001324ECE4|nr:MULTISPECIES: ADP-forming succinate--CoA ligase subunit beta [unclassified Lentimonas]CAA6677085.1 Succinyl-CoA ligase [ADP-forming] beta chain (EC [Lentimonas sp. CC4]CAA6686293.1 Succinyl-CoA ligase [ADP-forming] beta chain (EC [Lentimonas sp. CC6]CAA6692356.1 Succinyl-CoA ligase [ADP-forming] beta chain (EC [Lentimonas sp. CC10]CAA6694693.1 Succinyl-CoA ligase [ADP-forming] beta chain (EC [Lentimonas sp. CC19]CAA7071438.1 Succinyl-CoA ligase [ADP-forming] beta chain (EC [Lentimonas sp. C